MPSRCGAPAILKRKHRRREADAPLLTVTRSPRPFPVLRLSSDWVASSFIAMNALSRREEETLTKTAKSEGPEGVRHGGQGCVYSRSSCCLCSASRQSLLTVRLVGLSRSHGNAEINTRRCRIACISSESGVLSTHRTQYVMCLLQVRGLSLWLPCARNTFDYDTNSKPVGKPHLLDGPKLSCLTVHTPVRQLTAQGCHTVVNVDQLYHPRCIRGLTSSVKLLVGAMHFGDTSLSLFRCPSENH